jgi:hypothetical protein
MKPTKRPLARQHQGRGAARAGLVVLAGLAGFAGLAVSAPRPAAADDDNDDPPFTIGSVPAWFLLGGVTSGGTLGVGATGGYVGAELSLARMRDGNYLGFYADGYYDFGIDGLYATGGLEAGHGFVGVDAGPAVRLANGGTDAGVAARASLSIGLFAVYVRYAYFDAMSDDHVIQVGGMLKFPLGSSFGGK